MATRGCNGPAAFLRRPGRTFPIPPAAMPSVNPPPRPRSSIGSSVEQALGSACQETLVEIPAFQPRVDKVRDKVSDKGPIPTVLGQAPSFPYPSCGLVG